MQALHKRHICAEHPCSLTYNPGAWHTESTEKNSDQIKLSCQGQDKISGQRRNTKWAFRQVPELRAKLNHLIVCLSTDHWGKDKMQVEAPWLHHDFKKKKSNFKSMNSKKKFLYCETFETAKTRYEETVENMEDNHGELARALYFWLIIIWVTNFVGFFFLSFLFYFLFHKYW